MNQLQISFGSPLIVQHQYLPSTKPKLLLSVVLDGITIIGDEAMDVKIPEGKRAKFQVVPQDVSGNPAPIDGNVTWSSVDQTLLQVVPDTASANQSQAWIENNVGGSLGVCGIKVGADADTGSGVVTISATFEFEAVAGQAAGYGLNQVGALEDIPPGP